MTGIRKHTIAGVLPKEWDAKLIKSCCDVVRGASPRPAGDPRYFDGDYLPWITVADVTGKPGMYLQGTRTRLTREGADFTRHIPPETLIITNSGATLGVPKITQELSGANDGIAVFLNLKGVSKECLFYILESKTSYFRNELAPGVGQPNLNTELLGDVAIPIPPAGEQEGIVRVLSTWDTAIQTTEQLIEAEEKRLSWLIRRIYSGNSHWKQSCLGDFLAPTRRLHGDGEYQIASVGKRGIRPRSEIYSKTLSNSYSGNILVEPNWLCFGLSSDAIAYGVNQTDEVYSVSPAYRTYRINGASPGFIDGYLRAFNAALSQRFLIVSARQGKAIDFDGLLGARCYAPSITEQILISKTLEEAKTQIELLRHTADRYRLQKRGLMQKLLTGQWRLPVRGEVSA
jgi:type I restriction enzyme S subunit